MGLQAATKPKEQGVLSRESIRENLIDLIMNRRRGLENMYGNTEDKWDKILEAPINQGEEMARKLITEMGCNRGIAKDLTVLTLYDVAILIGMFWCWCSFIRVLLIVGWMDR